VGRPYLLCPADSAATGCQVSKRGWLQAPVQGAHKVRQPIWGQQVQHGRVVVSTLTQIGHPPHDSPGPRTRYRSVLDQLEHDCCAINI